MDILQSITVQPSSTDALKEHALETIGYICQDIVSSCFLYAPAMSNLSWINLKMRLVFSGLAFRPH